MRRLLVPSALLLTLAGCVVQPNGGYGYGYGGAPAPYYGQPGQVMYGDSEVYPGYSYNDGAPTYLLDGVPVPLIYFGGTWGYYDHYHSFHRAPEPVWRNLESRHPQGYGVRPYNPGAQPPHYGNTGGRPPPAASYSAPPPSGYHGAPPAGGYGGHAPQQYSAPPAAAAPSPYHAAPPQYHAPPPGAGAPPRPAPAAAPQSQDHHGGGTRCPPGQTRC